MIRAKPCHAPLSSRQAFFLPPLPVLLDALDGLTAALGGSSAPNWKSAWRMATIAARPGANLYVHPSAPGQQFGHALRVARAPSRAAASARTSGEAPLSNAAALCRRLGFFTAEGVEVPDQECDRRDTPPAIATHCTRRLFITCRRVQYAILLPNGQVWLVPITVQRADVGQIANLPICRVSGKLATCPTLQNLGSQGGGCWFLPGALRYRRTDCCCSSRRTRRPLVAAAR